MMLCLLLLAMIHPQLTWYEIYERGEKHYTRGEFTECIDDMNAALALKDTPKRNQFTRAVQKIDYKPFYYLALSHHKLGQLDDAFSHAQKAYEGDVVRNLPVLQNDLAQILIDWRTNITKVHSQYQAELDIIKARTQMITLLSEDKLDEVGQLLASVKEPDKFNDIRMQLTTRQEIKDKTSALYEDLSNRIEKMIQGSKPELARVLFEETKNRLPLDARNRLEKKLAEIPITPPQEPQPSETITENKPPAEDKPNLIAQEEIDRFRARMQLLESQTVGLRAELAEMTQSNQGLERRLADRKDDVKSIAPQPLLLLKAGDGEILVDAHAISPLVLVSWQLLLNGSIVATPPIPSPNGNDYRLTAKVPVKRFGEHELTFLLSDELGGTATLSQMIRLNPPFYHHPLLWSSLLALCILAVLIRWFLALRRKRRAQMAHFNPYIAGSPVRNLGMFYGRDALMHRIQALVHKNSFMIHGARRIGKTSMLLQLKKNLAALESEDYKFFPAFIDLQGVREDDLFHHMMDELLSHRDDWDIETEELAFREGQQESYQARQFSKDIKTLITLLGKATHHHIQLVLLMDEVDVLNEFSEKTNQKLRGIFMKDFAEHLSCVMAGIHLKQEWDSAGSPWYNFFEQIPVDAFAEEDARALILDPVKGIFTYEKEAVSLIVEGTARHPYLIQKVCISLIGDQLKVGNFRITTEQASSALDRLNEEIQRNTHELHNQQMGQG